MRNIGFEILEIISQDEWVAIAGRLMADVRGRKTEVRYQMTEDRGQRA
jgi:hypothetical protein